jgi:hypothetical protein
MQGICPKSPKTTYVYITCFWRKIKLVIKGDFIKLALIEGLLSTFWVDVLWQLPPQRRAIIFWGYQESIRPIEIYISSIRRCIVRRKSNKRFLPPCTSRLSLPLPTINLLESYPLWSALMSAASLPSHTDNRRLKERILQRDSVQIPDPFCIHQESRIYLFLAT